ncbi:uncharacterized protein LOC119548514 [Drosophila subpulchrella]|uniref:uncharacterized protein LOC119548514 n=1 Tax=Drosophila subpulchrella TaxID=1486046 RepID=UPI0018A19F7C|nr:uncharacterized protein LOC119548514 [Drosophila subpulchrella]
MNYPKRKPLSWSQYYEELLFDLWEENIASIRAGQKSTIVCKAMAEKLDEAGFIGVEMKDVRTKLDNITRKYKIEAREGHSKWKHFSRIRRILGVLKPVKVKYDHLIEQSTDDNGKQEPLSVKSESLNDDLDQPGILSDEDGTSWDRTLEMLSNPGSLCDDLPYSPQCKKAKLSPDDMTSFEAGMLAATKERNRELKQMRKELTNLASRRLNALEKLQMTMERMEQENAKFHEKLLQKL